MGSNYTQPVNIGNPIERTIEGNLIFGMNFLSLCRQLHINGFCSLSVDFAVIIRDLIGGKTSKIETMPAVEDDPQRRKPDITRAKKFLNWEPRVPLKVGLDKTIEYFRKELERSNHSNRNIYVPKDEHTSSKSNNVPKDEDYTPVQSRAPVDTNS